MLGKTHTLPVRLHMRPKNVTNSYVFPYEMYGPVPEPPSSLTSHRYMIQPFGPKNISPGGNQLTCQSQLVHLLYGRTQALK